MRRVAVTIEGTVQGVGFRPFVYAAATAHGLSGWVKNGAGAVHLEVQGPSPALKSFLDRLSVPPRAARVTRIATQELPLEPARDFCILESTRHADLRPTLPPDRAPCERCAAEVGDPAERRHRYPFTNCTECGPRYSIVESLPYDRPRTTMREFPLCEACAAEYRDPQDRRFHAEPIACPACGPRARLLSVAREELAAGDAALELAASYLLEGKIVALQGVGGFQLLTDATSDSAVGRLRARKHREEKPFAVLFASLERAREACLLSEAESGALLAPEAPILLMRRAPGALIAPSVAPGNPWLGALLPSTPLHRLLSSAVGRPLVCTSGNLSDEPMCIDEDSALAKLGGIADAFLVHDRRIARPVDDSVGRVGSRGLSLLRRARGFVPLPLALAPRGAAPRCVVATGAHLKSTVALYQAGQALVSQHLGDLSSTDAALLHERTIADLLDFFAAAPELVACDLHPDYVSTRAAERLAGALGVPLLRVQHHHAHVAACLAEHDLVGPVLGFAWDGAGLGPDGSVWGGEALIVDGASFQRVAHLRPFPLPGGEAALREPWRAALGALYEIMGESAAGHLSLEPARARVLLDLLERAPLVTSSMGRLFDAIAALSGVRASRGYEGQAAQALELAADGVDASEAYPLPLGPGAPAVADWEPLVRAVLRDSAAGLPAGLISARFHGALVDLAEAVAVRIGLERVVLSGGCFQNFRLVEAVRERLVATGFTVYAPELYPPNDGGLSLGQLYVALHREEASHVPGHSG